jgi:hypothetical protein
MVRFITLFLLFFSSIALLKAQTYSWPCPPFNGQHWINGTFCENRTSGSIARHHFHDGVDIHLPQGNEVFAVVDGIVDGIGTAEDYGINSYVRVGRYAYVHIDPNPNLEIGQSVNAFETILGTTNSWNHLHFKDGWPGSEINPLRPDGGLDPFFDAFPPVINSTDFYVNGTTTRFLNDRVYGKVDIIALASDKTDEGPLGNNNGIYKIGYQIFDASGSIAESDLIQNLVFEQIPLSDAYITNVYFNGSDLSTYFYTTTNKITGDSYWNSDNFSKGTHRIKVLTEDTRGNTAIAWKTIQIVTPDNSAPAIPELNSLVGNSGNQWILDWQVNDSTDIAGYELSFSLDGEIWSVQKTISASLSPADSQLIYTNYPNDAVIYFRLKAYDQAAFPNYSADSDVFGVRLSAAGADVLIVDGFDRTDGYWTAQTHSFLINYGQILDELGLSFDTCSDDAVREGTIQLTDYPIVI